MDLNHSRDLQKLAVSEWGKEVPTPRAQKAYR